MKSWMYTAALLALSSIPAVETAGADGQTEAAELAAAGLVGYWPLRGSARALFTTRMASSRSILCRPS